MKLKKIFSETNEPISTKLCWNDPWMVPFQNCVHQRFLFLAMAAILDTGRRWWTQFWKGTIQGSFQQSLVEIGSLPKFELFKHNDELFNIYYGIFYELWTFAYFDRLCKLEKRGDEIKKKSSPLKLLSQSQPNFAEIGNFP
jgi:hypothetical protein